MLTLTNKKNKKGIFHSFNSHALEIGSNTTINATVTGSNSALV